MTTYDAPVRDMRFLIHEFLGVERFSNLPGFADATPDLIDAILEEGGKIHSELLHPLNHVGDQEGCTYNDGVVTTPSGFKDAYKTYTEGGWANLTCDPEYGGQGLPHAIGIAINEMVNSSNLAFSMYTGLTFAAHSAIDVHGTEEQKQKYLPNMVSGKWTGTMNLTEPHCGTDLGLMRSKAVPQEDGSYKISGTKIFISAGEHDLSENIIHLVLAKIPGGPEGIKGVSLFIVPKFHINEDGSSGDRNGVMCGSIEHKMGINANSTCVMNYDEATGYLLGEEHKGMRAMFTMMNEARIGVAMQGLAQSSTSYQNAVTYANERLQGRSLTGDKAPDQAADPLIVHPDIRRMLLNQRAFNEGARAALYWLALQGDLMEGSEDEATRQRAEDYLALFTPVIKGYFTDKAFAHCVDAQQVYGGHGYIQETGMDQFVRDARITMIYEGANGVQALDLVGRKLGANGGRAIMSFMGELSTYLEENAANEELTPFIQALRKVKGDMDKSVGWLMENGLKNPDDAGAASVDFMHLMGVVLLTYMWVQIAQSCQKAIAEGDGDPFYATKLKIAQYYIERTSPESGLHLRKLITGSATMMSLPADAF